MKWQREHFTRNQFSLGHPEMRERRLSVQGNAQLPADAGYVPTPQLYLHMDGGTLPLGDASHPSGWEAGKWWGSALVWLQSLA